MRPLRSLVTICIFLLLLAAPLLLIKNGDSTWNSTHFTSPQQTQTVSLKQPLQKTPTTHTNASVGLPIVWNKVGGIVIPTTTTTTTTAPPVVTVAQPTTPVAPTTPTPAPGVTGVVQTPPTTQPPAPPTPVAAPSPAPSPDPTVSAPAPGDYDHRWDAVARCEEGGWIGYAGPAYPDSLGISATNWYANGGVSDLSPAAQVAVAQRIEGTSFVPDQNGCAAW